MSKVNKTADKIFKTALAGLLLFTIVTFGDTISANTINEMEKIIININESTTLTKSVSDASAIVEKENGWEVLNNDDNITFDTDTLEIKALKVSEQDITINHTYKYKTEESTDTFEEVTDSYTISVVDPNAVVGEESSKDETNKEEVSEIGGVALPVQMNTSTSYALDADVTNLYTVSFNINGGNGSNPDKISGTKGSEITLPNYEGTKDGATFIGWSNAAALNTKEYHPVYPVGSTYTINDTDSKGTKNITLYAVWSVANKGATFYIRKDGKIPYEPQQYTASEYTGGIFIQSALKQNVWTCDNSGINVVANINTLPTDAQIKSVLSDYNPDTQYIKWYVIKSVGGDSWHVDGVVLTRNKLELKYDGNSNTGTVSKVPTGAMYEYNSQVKVGHDGGNDGELLEPERKGYLFAGWNTAAEGNGTKYNSDNTFSIIETTTLYAQWDADPGTQYKIEYYLENADKTYSNTPSEVAIRKGFTDAAVNATIANYTGYTFDETNPNNIKSGTISADGTLVLKLYYKINNYNVTYSPGEYGSFNQQTSSVIYGTDTPKFNGETTSKNNDYYFSGWSPEVSDTVSGDVEYVAQWSKTNEITIEAVKETVTYNGTVQKISGSKAFKTLEFKIGDKTYKVSGIDATVQGKDAGIYDLVINHNGVKVTESGKDVTNQMKINYINGSFTIKPISIVLTSASAEKMYDGSPLTKNKVDVTSGEFVNGEGFSATCSASLTKVGDIKNVFTYKLNDNTNSKNYNITTVHGTLNVYLNTVDLKASAKDVDTTYDGLEHGINVESSIKDATVITVYKDANGNVIEGLPTNAGTYTATTTVSKEGYKTVELNNEVIIKKIDYKVAITGNSDFAMYDGTKHSVSGYEVKTELPEGIKISLKDGVETVATGTNAITSENAYKMGLSANSFNVVSQNYNVELLVTDGELIINPRPLTITVDNANKYVGDNDPEFSANVEGLLDADTLEYTLNREAGENAGDYSINVDYVNNPNYIVVVYPGTFSIITRTAPLNPPTNPTPTDPTVVPNVNIPTVINAINNNVQNIIVTPINEQIAQDATPQSEKVDDATTPKSGLIGNYWALINLICAALTVLGGIIILIGKHSKEEDEDDENQQYNVEGEEKENEKTRRRWTKFFGTFVALISVIVFVLTEDWTLPMVLLDKYTIIMVVIALVQAVTLVIAKKWKKADNDDNKEAQAA